MHTPAPILKWTKEKCIAEAQKYTTISIWQKASIGSYTSARVHGWFEDCIKHMPELQHPEWTLIECKEVAKQYISRTDWQHGNSGSYQAAQYRGWLDECCIHMKLLGGTSRPEQALLQIIREYYPKAQKTCIGKKQDGIGKRFELDIYVPEVRKGIEFNGTYWHSPAGLKRGRPTWPEEMLKNYHEIKRQFFTDRNIYYLEITEVEWQTNQAAVLQKILAFLKAN